MAKKKESVIGNILKNIGIVIGWFFRKLGLFIDWLGTLIWNIIHRSFELVFWVWGFALVTILVATAAFLFWICCERDAG